jgi:hypothetical protein
VNEMRKALLLAVGTVGFVSGLATSGCLQTSQLVCIGGTTQCNVTCIDLTTDPSNCGACGVPCQPHAVCIPTSIDGGVTGVCECPSASSGSSLTLCNGACSDITTDPNNCGGCGLACASGQVCSPSPTADGGLTGTCQSSCVPVALDPNNCGSCGNACPQGYGCHYLPGGPALGSCVPDLVVACIAGNSGSVAPVRDSPVQPVVGPGVAAGPVPGALGILGDGLLVGATRLGELALRNLSVVAPENPLLGSAPDYIETVSRPDAGSWVTVVDGISNTLTVLSGPPELTARIQLPDGGIQGLGLTVDGGYGFGQGTSPEPFARVGDDIFVPLYGAFGGSPDAGGQVVRLRTSNPSAPTPVGSYNLNSISLPTFDGGQAFPRPSQALLHQGFVYVVLNNLDINYAPAGPSLLVKIDPDAGVGTLAQVLQLDPNLCLDAVGLANAGDARYLLVSCFGQVSYGTNFQVTAATQSGVLLLDVNDNVVSSWSPQCPDAGPACTPPIPGALAVANGRIYVGDQSSGRLFVLTLDAGQLYPLVDYGPDGGMPLQPCPAGVSSVSAIVVVP